MARFLDFVYSVILIVALIDFPFPINVRSCLAYPHTLFVIWVLEFLLNHA